MDAIIIIIAIGLLIIGFKLTISNAVLPHSKIDEHLKSKKLKYVRHERVKKPWNPSFENDETIFYVFAYRKHYYRIIALNNSDNQVEIEATWYQSYSLFHKNKVFFKTKQ